MEVILQQPSGCKVQDKYDEVESGGYELESVAKEEDCEDREDGDKDTEDRLDGC